MTNTISQKWSEMKMFCSLCNNDKCVYKTFQNSDTKCFINTIDNGK